LVLVWPVGVVLLSFLVEEAKPPLAKRRTVTIFTFIRKAKI
jgi:hypothetical protein